MKMHRWQRLLLATTMCAAISHGVKAADPDLSSADAKAIAEVMAIGGGDRN